MPDIYKDAASSAEPAKSTEMADALAAPRTVILGGKPFTAHLLTFNDLVIIEEKLGDISYMDLTRVAHQRLILHLSLRTQTEQEAGELLNITHIQESQGVLDDILKASGLVGDPDTREEEATPEKKPTARKAKSASPA